MIFYFPLSFVSFFLFYWFFLWSYFLYSAYFGFYVLSFCNFLRQELKSLIWNFSFFLLQVFSAINFLLSSALPASHQFCMLCLCFLSSKQFPTSNFISSLTHGLFGNMLFSFQVFGDFSVVLLLIPNFITLWSENTLSMTYILLNLLRCFSYSRIWWSILVNVLFVCKKNVYSAVFGWTVLYVSIKSG